MIRLSVLSFCWSVSRPISFPLGAALFNSGGYICVMATSLLLFLIAAILGLWKLWNFEEKIGKNKVKFLGILIYYHIYRFFISFKIHKT